MSDEKKVDYDAHAERALLWDLGSGNIEEMAEQAAQELGLPVSEVLNLNQDEKARWDRYLAALRAVLSTRDGQIVLRHWLDTAKAFERIFQTNSNIYRAAALNDYAQDRLEEIAVAGQKFHYEILHQGHRNAAFDKMLKKKNK